jgi:sensor domain CHASE-containing protein
MTMTTTMTIRQRTICSLALTLIGLLALLGGMLYLITARYIAALEQKDTLRELEHMASALKLEIESLSTLAADWGAWDDTYAFVTEPTPTYTQSNLTPESLANLNVHLFAVLDRDGQFRIAYQVNPHAFAVSQLSDSVRRAVRDLGRTAQTSPRAGISLRALPDGPYLIALQPILTSARNGPSRGVLIFGRRLDKQKLAQISWQSARQVVLVEDGAQERTLLRQIHASRATWDSQQSVVLRNDWHLVGVRRHRTLRGHWVYIQVFIERTIREQGWMLFRLVLGWMVAIGVVIGGSLFG